MTARSALRWLNTARVLERMSQQQTTPMVAIRVALDGRDITIRLKLESVNTWGSIKDRTALGLVASVASALVHPDTTLVESTSGNLGTALAEIAKDLDRQFIAVVDPNLSPALAARMRDSGARLDYVTRPDRHGGYLDARLARVEQLLDTTPGAIWTDQYHNPANPLAHYRSTAPELLRQVPDCDAVFAAVSTGGTLAGISWYMRRYAPQARMIAVDVPGSRIFGEPTGPRLLTGIGASRKSSFLAPGVWDDMILVEDAAAIAVCHQVRDATGIYLGGSSGAAVAACLGYTRRHPDITAPVCVCPDGGAAYRLTIYDPHWLESRSVQLTRWELPVVFRGTEGSTDGE
jgi:N-(2-amino-2-carboxyethyl)-L-glutamate synthase